MIYIYVTLLLIGGMLLYTRLANKYLIFDKPNERSSHTKPTIRGGGVVFLLAIFFTGLLYHPDYWIPVAGACAIGIISFLDDNMELSQRLRLVVHFLSISLVFYYLPVFTTLAIWQIVALYVLVIGIINAYNFMDGINGITGLYSLVVLAALQYVNLYQFSFVEPDLIRFPLIACCVFLFYNFRKKAKVFAGDVGSITIAFWIVFLVFNLILKTNNWNYLLFFSVYGVDTVLTIVHRLMLKQNIFKAHRLHFYQILANEQKMSHLIVSSIYAFIQLLIVFFILSTDLSFVVSLLISSLPLAVFYIIMKPRLMKPSVMVNVVISTSDIEEERAVI